MEEERRKNEKRMKDEIDVSSFKMNVVPRLVTIDRRNAVTNDNALVCAPDRKWTYVVTRSKSLTRMSGGYDIADSE